MKNIIYFENGIKHILTFDEMKIIQKAISEVTVPEENKKDLEKLKSLFIEHLD